MSSLKNKKRRRQSKSIIKPAVICEAIIQSKKGILLLKRSKNNDLYVGKWQLPGGKCEKNETPLECIKREIAEEVGCGCVELKKVRRISLRDDYRGRESKVILHVYSCKLLGRISLSADHSKFSFFFKSKLKRLPVVPLSEKAIFGK